MMVATMQSQRDRVWALFFAAVTLCVPQGGRAQTSQPSMQDQVLNNLRNSPVGNHTLEALQLPEDHLRRVADRILRSSYEQQFRVVVPDGRPTTTGPAELPAIAEIGRLPAPRPSPWPAIVTAALGVCALAAVIIAVQAVRARR
jgi:hypothetical protein